MAVSKRFIFSEEEQLAADFSRAVAHPARVRLLSKLAHGRVMRWEDLTSGFDLHISTVDGHLGKLKNAGLVVPVMMDDRLAGYQLNPAMYSSSLNAMRRVLQTTSVLRRLEENGYVGVG